MTVAPWLTARRTPDGVGRRGCRVCLALARVERQSRASRLSSSTSRPVRFSSSSDCLRYLSTSAAEAARTPSATRCALVETTASGLGSASGVASVASASSGRDFKRCPEALGQVIYGNAQPSSRAVCRRNACASASQLAQRARRTRAHTSLELRQLSECDGRTRGPSVRARGRRARARRAGRARARRARAHRAAAAHAPLAVAEARAADIDARRAAVRGDAGARARARRPLKRCALRLGRRRVVHARERAGKVLGILEEAWAAERTPACGHVMFARRLALLRAGGCRCQCTGRCFHKSAKI